MNISIPEGSKYYFLNLSLRNIPLAASNSYVIDLISDIVPVIGFMRKLNVKSNSLLSTAVLTVASLEDALLLLRSPLYFGGQQLEVVPHIYLGIEATHSYWVRGKQLVF